MLNFNRANKDVRIEVVDYSQFNTEDDYSAGVTKLNTEIISGNVPDIFVSDQLPIEQYGAKGLLYDLYTLIDADGELSRESFIPNILKAMESDGKLYSIASSFGIMSLVGNADVVGEEMGWTLQEMMDVINAHPEVQYVLDPLHSRPPYSDHARAEPERVRGLATGECSFNSQDFIDVLNFCNMSPEESTTTATTTSTPALVSSGRQLLATFSAGDFDSFQMYEAMFGGHLAFKGFPSAEGNGNVIMPTGSSLSISSTCKDRGRRLAIHPCHAR
ncbi:MAG: ABC transporter substrate-binding protein [Oscillospiraceae bacterium]